MIRLSLSHRPVPRPAKPGSIYGAARAASRVESFSRMGVAMTPATGTAPNNASKVAPRRETYVWPTSRSEALPWLIALGWIAVLVGLALRLWQVGAKSLWFDEVASIAIAAHPWSGIVDALRASNYPPLFAYLLKLWMLGGSSDTWLRAGPALLGAGLVALTWVWGRRLLGPHIALATTVLSALSTYEIYYSQYVRMYVLLGLLALLSLLLLTRAVEANVWRWWLAWSLSATACLYSFNYAIFVLLGEAAWLAILAVRQPELRRPAVIWCGLAGLLFLPWLPMMAYQYTHNAGARTWIPRPDLGTLPQTFTQLCFFAIGSRETWGTRLAYVGRDLMAVVLGLGIALRGEARERLLLALILVCGILLPMAASFVVKPFFDVRYVVFAAPAFYLLLARGLVRGLALLRSHLSARTLTSTLIVAVFCSAAVSLYPLRQLYASPAFGQADLRGATAALLRGYRPGDIVVHMHGFSLLPAMWYAYHTAGPGTRHVTQPYAMAPQAWQRLAPLPQVLIGAPFPASAWWLPRGAGRLWLVSLTDFRHGEAPTAALAWFHPPAQRWRLARQIIQYQGVLLRLYTRRS